MEKERVYSVGNDRLKRSWIKGFEVKEDTLIAKDDEGCIILPFLDRGQGEKNWGRIHMDINISEKSECTLYVMADFDTAVNEYFMNGAIAVPEKLEAFKRGCKVKYTNKRDVLLYDVEGRYLWICICMQGGKGNSVGGIKVYTKGDFIMETFPEIYRQRNSTLHRYLSIFSAIYKGLDEDMNKLPELFEPEKAPAYMLPELAGWMGLDVTGGFLRESTLRVLVKESYDLIRKRGTREALERLTEIITGEKAIIIERNLLPQPVSESQRAVENELYGDDIYGVTVIIKNSKDQYKKSQILYLMNQLKPARCTLKIVYLDIGAVLDGYTYIDINAGICGEEKPLGMDLGARIGQVL